MLRLTRAWIRVLQQPVRAVSSTNAVLPVGRTSFAQIMTALVGTSNKPLGARSLSLQINASLTFLKVIGVSGGVDSMALAALTSEWARDKNIEVHAVVVDHRLRRESSSEALHVRQMLQQRGIDTIVRNLYWEPNSVRSSEVAREKRFQVLSDQAQRVGAERIVLAHHLDDNMETCLMRLLVTSGAFALSLSLSLSLSPSE